MNKRDYDRWYQRRPERRGTCGECGGLKGIDCLPQHRCRSCWQAEANFRQSLVAGMYLAGWRLREIGDVLGTDARGAGMFVTRLRRKGWSLPARQTRTRWTQ